MEEFYTRNKEFIANTNFNFSCDCVTYGSHRIYFCVCVECLQDLQEAKNVHLINDRWIKFCLWETNLKSLSLNGTMRFFRYRDIELPIH